MAKSSCVNCWTLFILVFFVLLLIYFWSTPSLVATTAIYPTAAAAATYPYATAANAVGPCRICDVSLGEQQIFGSQCCPIVQQQMVPAPTVSAATIPPPTVRATPGPEIPTPSISAFANTASLNSIGTATSTPNIRATALSSACDPGTPCSKVETVQITPPAIRANVPTDFYKSSFIPEDVRCNDIQYANHCAYPGKYAFLRAPSQRYQDFGLDGVYGGRYCQAQCEPRYESDGDKHCVCICTVAPTPTVK